MLKSFLQTEAWVKFKEKFGWQAHHFEGLIGLERSIGFGRRLLYFPELPLNTRTVELIQTIKAQTPSKGRIFTRFEFLELWTPPRAKQLLELGLVKAFEDVQPDYRQWVLLEGSEEALLKQMKPKGRYNIRVAERHRLAVAWGVEEEQVAALAHLYQETARRTGFAGRSQAYFQSLVAALAKEQLGEIVTISHRGTVLAAALVSFYGGVASYLYGGSAAEERGLMAPYLMHWAAIKRAKEKHCAIYDLLAIAPLERENHPHAGLTRFKTQFGGQSVRLLGSWDLVHAPTWYTLYKFAQQRRRRAI